MTVPSYGATPITMREPCRACGATYGLMHPMGNGVNKQNVVRCGNCAAWVYNAPKTETGEKPLTVKSARNGVGAAQWARLMERATGHCEVCGSAEELCAGHVLSIDDGVREGFSARDLNGDDNLIVLCASCNLGLGHMTMHPRLFLAICRRRMARHD